MLIGSDIDQDLALNRENCSRVRVQYVKAIQTSCVQAIIWKMLQRRVQNTVLSYAQSYYEFKSSITHAFTIWKTQISTEKRSISILQKTLSKILFKKGLFQIFDHWQDQKRTLIQASCIQKLLKKQIKNSKKQVIATFPSAFAYRPHNRIGIEQVGGSHHSQAFAYTQMDDVWIRTLYWKCCGWVRSLNKRFGCAEEDMG